MRLLLDTHALLWWVSGYAGLRGPARAAIADLDNVKFVSAASAMEISTKFRLGKLPQAAELVAGFDQVIASQAFEPLDVTIAHARLAGSLPIRHGDPFDRLLIAQAMIEDLTLVSNEKLFDSFGVSRIW